jgi:hypothetical protein
VATENFTDRMRERMPAHRIWRDVGASPAMSRPAQDAMWEEMRERLRSFERERRTLERRSHFAEFQSRLHYSDGRSLGVILVVGGLLVFAVVEFFR